jgi:hypothetical protein
VYVYFMVLVILFCSFAIMGYAWIIVSTVIVILNYFECSRPIPFSTQYSGSGLAPPFPPLWLDVPCPCDGEIFLSTKSGPPGTKKKKKKGKKSGDIIMIQPQPPFFFVNLPLVTRIGIVRC